MTHTSTPCTNKKLKTKYCITKIYTAHKCFKKEKHTISLLEEFMFAISIVLQKVSTSQLVTQLPRDFPRYLTPFPRDFRNIAPAPVKPAAF